MKTNQAILATPIIAAVLLNVNQSRAQGSAFTFQKILSQSNAPA